MNQRFNISRARKYTANGEEKTSWDAIGTVTILETPTGKTRGFVNIFALGEFSLFAMDKKEDQPDLSSAEEALIGTSSHTIDLEDIPF